MTDKNKYLIDTSEIGIPISACGDIPPINSIIFCNPAHTEVLRIEPEGHIFWNGREIVGDDEFKAAIVDLRNCLMGRR